MRSSFLLFFLIFFLSSLQSDVIDHLRKIENKANIHQMRNIDFIYMINLDQRPEKLEKSLKQLHPYGIYPYRFSAINGWELTLEEINAVGVKYAPGMDNNLMASSYLTNRNFKIHNELICVYDRTYFGHCMM
ncbi:MAG: hypothetical protein K940chlam6_00825 [Chlamydiae bacterium]|nr:hypothetical protein [Chlamydiota bacterium]